MREEGLVWEIKLKKEEEEKWCSRGGETIGNGPSSNQTLEGISLVANQGPVANSRLGQGALKEDTKVYGAATLQGANGVKKNTSKQPPVAECSTAAAMVVQQPNASAFIVGSPAVAGGSYSGGDRRDSGGFDARKALKGITNEHEESDTDGKVSRWTLEHEEDEEDPEDDQENAIMERIQVLGRQGYSTRSTTKKKGKTKMGTKFRF